MMKKNTNRTIALLTALLTASALLFSSCGGAGEDETKGKTEVTTTAGGEKTPGTNAGETPTEPEEETVADPEEEAETNPWGDPVNQNDGWTKIY